jgi:hypothetical protein
VNAGSIGARSGGGVGDGGPATGDSGSGLVSSPGGIGWATPQWGQRAGIVETGFPQARHWPIGIASSYFFAASSRAARLRTVTPVHSS